MKQRSHTREDKLEKQCAVLADIIIAIRPVYLKADATQKALIETMIGAAIWYIPKPATAWTGYISEGALKAFHPDSGIQKPKISEEHVYPRKVAARLLLEDHELSASTMAILFRDKYGRLHYITSDENKGVQPYLRANVFTTPDEAYKAAGVFLIKVDPQDLKQIKRRNPSIINAYLKSQKTNRAEQGVAPYVAQGAPSGER